MLNVTRTSLLILLALTLGASFFFYHGTRARAEGGTSGPAGEIVCTPPPPGMAAWWPGEGNGDDIRGANPLTQSFGVPQFVPAKVEEGMKFDGSSGFAAPDDPALNFGAGSFSLDLWVRIDAVPGANGAVLVEKRNNTAVGYVLSTDGTGLFFTVRGDSGVAQAQISSVGAGFHHIAIAVDRVSGNNATMYLDGVAQSPVSVASIGNTNNTGRLFVGQNSLDSGTSAGPFNGVIDELELFNRSLSQSEIQAIVSAGTAGKCRPRCTPPPSGMISWWDGDDDPFDRHGTNHGTLQNGATFGDGKVGRAFSLNGTDAYVQLPSDSSLDPTDAGSLDAWVKLNQLPLAADHVMEIVGTDNSNAGNDFDLEADTNDNFLFSVEDGATATSTTVIQTGVWYHVAGTWDSTGIRIYVNGVLEDTNSSHVTRSLGGEPMEIGHQFGSGNTFFNGLIDEVEMFNRALDITDIQAINNAGFAGKCKLCLAPPANMVGWWNGDANPNDSSGNGNNGTLQGGTAFAVGKVGQAFNFNAAANSGVIVPPGSSLNPTDAITLDAWVKPSSFPNSGPAVIRKDSNGAGTTQYSLNVGDGITTGVAHCNIGGTIGATGGSVPLNQWSHLACTYDRENLRVYVNGVEVASAAGTSAIPTAATNLAIGKEDLFTDRNFDGVIDEVEIFDRALTQTEIQSIVAAGASGKCKLGCTPPPANMVSWWDGSGSGSAVNDIQGANVASLQGGAVFTTAKVGQGFGFDGTSAYVNVPDNANLYSSGSFTTDAWIKTSQNTGFQQIIAHYECSGNCPANSNSVYDLYIDDDKLEGQIRDTTGADQILTGTQIITDGKFHHVALQRDIGQNQMVLYLDGAIDASATLIPTGALKDDDGFPDPVTIGTVIQNNNPGCGCPLQFFTGVIDEVEYFNRALSLSEVQAIFNAGGAGKCKTGGATPIVQAGDATITFPNGSGAGTTTYQTLPTYQAGPMPFGYNSPLHIADISTTAVVPGTTHVCFNLQAPEFALAPFTQLRILHLEGNLLVNRTSFSSPATGTLCADVGSLSPFVIAQNTNAPTAAPASIAGTITTANGLPLAGVSMSLGGARSVRTITDSNGNYSFSNLDTDQFYTVTPSLMNYHFSPAELSFSLLGNKTDAVFTATRDAAIIGNVIDSPDYFVRQHYLDFLGREPDDSGFNFWSDQISSCGSNAACLEVKRINVSAAYFLSIEFQQTGGLVDGLYRAGYGSRPQYAEFMADQQRVAQGVVVGRSGWEQELAANRAAFLDAFVQRSAFRAAYDSLSNSAYVDALIGHTGVSFSQTERDALVNGLTSGSLTRGAVLGQIAENDGFVRSKFNQAFVLMEYFGYLRRDPDESGYQFWLTKLNQFNGNFVQAEMVKAFITSGEYRQRFSQ